MTSLPSRIRPTRLVLPLVALCALLSCPGPMGAEEKPAARVASQSLFDGTSLAGWKPSAFDSQGKVKVENPFRDGSGAIVIERTDYLSGITRSGGGELPRTNYEISLEAMKLAGSDFFCGLTFPVGESACTFVVGGWGGMVVGLSCVDNNDASENETTQGMEFKPDRWYSIRVRVTPEKIEAWIDQEKMVDLEITGRRIDLRFGDIQHSLPLGVAAFQTRAAFREIYLRPL